MSQSTRKPDAKGYLVLIGFAFAGWALCAAVMGIGQATMSIDSALIVHAAAAPLIFATLSLLYFGRFGTFTPLQTAIAFVAFVIAMDAVVMAGLVLRDYTMFTSVLGTWLPFALIFLSTYLTGLYCEHAQPRASPA